MTDYSATTRPSRIPDFSSIEEEAEWWDTHEITDYLDELRPVTLEVSQEIRGRVAARANQGDLVPDPLVVELRSEDRAELDRRAREQGVEPGELVQSWIEERLGQPGERRRLVG